MLMHESHVFQLPVETKFQVYDPRIVYFYFILFHFFFQRYLCGNIFSTEDAAKNVFPTSKISAQEIRHKFFLIWSTLTIMAHIMGLGNQSESWKIIILS